MRRSLVSPAQLPGLDSDHLAKWARPEAVIALGGKPKRPSVCLELREKKVVPLSLHAIRYLNAQLRKLNQGDLLELADRKCNSDVEIGRDIMLDFAQNICDTFVLWSGDSDFADPIRQLLKDGKRVYLFATARRVARELDALQHDSLTIYDIEKLRDFVCWARELRQDERKAA